MLDVGVLANRSSEGFHVLAGPIVRGVYDDPESLFLQVLTGMARQYQRLKSLEVAVPGLEDNASNP
jgi:hypothetical protein